MDYIKLKEAAIKVSTFSYAPYSNFHVGASIQCKDGTIYSGCNIENRSYGLTNCAERSAVFNAIGNGKKDFAAIAIYSPDSAYPLPPCGACRQVLTEFCDKSVPVFFAGKDKNFEMLLLKELYPFDSLHDLKKEHQP
ncbi:MAG: cytidine deaminase [Spirochaetaceae bacterium]|nr:cytidine deaminase [Spirochaetaceae bacterium]